MTPYSPIPRFVRGDGHSSLIRRVLRKDVDPDVRRMDLVTTTRMRLSLVDTGHNAQEHIAEGDTCVHILYQSAEDEAHIAIGGERAAIAPGDFAWVSAGDAWELSPDQLAITVAVRSSAFALPVYPTHGEYHFDGYNRETVAPSSSGISLSRWKITQPLTLPNPDKDCIYIGLWSDLAMQYPGGVSMLQQGHTSVIRPGLGQLTLVPDGLAHVLAIETD